MISNAQIWQVARLLGQDEFLNCLALSSLDGLQSLDALQCTKVRQCAHDNVNRITRALVHEAAARDDVNTAVEAADFLEQRLAGLGDLLEKEARDQIREGFRLLTARWGC